MWKCAATDHGVTADRLTMLGPRPVIASLSLGATRTFRMHCMAAQDTQSHAARQQQQHDQAVTPSQSQHAECSASLKASLGSSAQPISQVNQQKQQDQQQQAKRVSSSPDAIGNGASAQPAVQPGGVSAAAQSKRVTTVQQSQQAGCVSSIDVVLPHNTLLIMWPPMQEAWKHEVPGPVHKRVLNTVQFLMLLQCSSLSRQHCQCSTGEGWSCSLHAHMSLNCQVHSAEFGKRVCVCVCVCVYVCVLLMCMCLRNATRAPSHQVICTGGYARAWCRFPSVSM